MWTTRRLMGSLVRRPTELRDEHLRQRLRFGRAPRLAQMKILYVTTPNHGPISAQIEPIT